MKKRSISSQLFRLYAGFFSFFLSLLLIVFFLYVGIDLNRNIIATQEQMLQTMKTNIDNSLSEFNSISLSLVNSKAFCEIATKTLPAVYTSGQNPMSSFYLLYTASTYSILQKGYRIGVLTVEGDYVWMGSNFFIHNVGAPEKSFLPYGKFNIEVIDTNPSLDKINEDFPWSGDENGKSVRIVRTIFHDNSFSLQKGQLEIYMPYEKIETMMKDLSSRSPEGVLLGLYDKNGSTLYGEDLTVEEGGQLSTARWKANRQIVYSYPMLSGEAYMVSRIQVSNLYSSLYGWITMAVISFVFLNLLLLWVTYKISIKFTQPIASICAQVDALQLEHAIQQPAIETDVVELDVLARAVVNMQHKLVVTLEESVRLRSLEIHSRMLALQSQMQPHFLYNTLMTIGALCEEENSAGAAKVSYNLIHMLQYISVEQGGDVTIAEELRQVSRYIDIMLQRFPNLQFTQNIPVEILGVHIPRLLIQPLVENSVKFCEHADCKIFLDGHVEGNSWSIRVVDNGQGFSDEERDKILKNMVEIAKNYQKVSLQINGMGLANIYMRLWILYGEDMEFSIESQQGVTTCITIGGLIRNGGVESDQ